MKVSVLVTTYNHEKYISMALDSILKQETDFDFEILIGEDDSDDGTREICKRYAAQHSGLIRLFLNDRKNVIFIDGQPTGRWNFINLFTHANGEYIARCEGDDYWTDIHKLQKQVDFLKERLDFSICYHHTDWLENGKLIKNTWVPPSSKPFYTTDDLFIYNNFMRTNSVVFRNRLFDLPEWFKEVPFGDFTLHILNSLHGKIGYIDETMGVYRVHGGGSWSSKNPVFNLNKTLKTYSIIAEQLGFTDNRAYLKGISTVYYNIAAKAKKLGDTCQVQSERKISIRSRETVQDGFKVTAIIAAYNEGDVIYHVVGDLVEQGIQVYFIDHHSTDNTVEEVSQWLGKGLHKVETFPEDAGFDIPNNIYSWRYMLQRKEQIARDLGPGWYIHADADEFRESPWFDLNFKQAIQKVDGKGYNAINFKIYDFKPIDNSFRPGDDVRKYMQYYSPPVLNVANIQVKCWKNFGQQINLWESGGHQVEFTDRKIFSIPFILRHYPIRSQEHGLQKIFNERKNRWDQTERRAKWHGQYDQINDKENNFIREKSELTFYNRRNVCKSLIKRYSSGVSAANGVNSKPKPVLVLGMHRSGTSLIMNILHKAGFYIGEENDLLGAAPDNPNGFFERKSVIYANDWILQACGGSWDNPPGKRKIEKFHVNSQLRSILKAYNGYNRYAIKDPRLCLTFPLWEKVLGKDIKIVYIERDKYAVAESLKKRNNFAFNKSIKLWENYTERARRYSKKRSVFSIPFEQLFTDERNDILERLKAFLNLDTDLVEMANTIINPKLNHYVQKPKVSIIILSYNALEYTRKCVESIQEHTFYPHEIIFVDNASEDRTISYLRELVGKNTNYKLISNESNRGFAAGNNQGVEAATGEYVMLLNNDVLVGDGWLESMVNSLERSEIIGMVGPITNHISGRQMIQDVPYSDDQGFYKYAQFVKKGNNGLLTPRRRIAGFAVLMRKKTYEEINGFDESFGIGNFEDDDLCLKVREKGYAIMVDESTFIHHFGSRTFKANKMDYHQSLKEKGKKFSVKWPDVDYEELLEIKNPLNVMHPKLLKQASDSLIDGKVEQARTDFKKVLIENPLSLDALFGLTLCARQQGDNETALRYLKQMLDIDPDNAVAYNQSGLISAEIGDLEGARALFMAAVEKDPAFIDAQRNYGEILIELEEYDDGVQTFVRILEHHPDDISTLLRMAQLHVDVGKKEEAKEYAEQVLKYDPENKNALAFTY